MRQYRKLRIGVDPITSTSMIVPRKPLSPFTRHFTDFLIQRIKRFHWALARALCDYLESSTQYLGSNSKRLTARADDAHTRILTLCFLIMAPDFLTKNEPIRSLKMWGNNRSFHFCILFSDRDTRDEFLHPCMDVVSLNGLSTQTQLNDSFKY